jgi:multisubunit Na+/H+ antiporter MnhG subunit
MYNSKVNPAIIFVTAVTVTFMVSTIIGVNRLKDEYRKNHEAMATDTDGSMRVVIDGTTYRLVEE